MYITEDQVRALLSVEECIEVLRKAFAQEFINIPRYRLRSENSLLHVMSASIPAAGIMGLKAYSTSRASSRFVVLLFDEKNGSLMAVLDADALGQIRTGAASGLATDLLANGDARVGAVIGSGHQAETQLRAIAAVRSLEEIRIYSRTPEKRKAFIDRMQSGIRARLRGCETAEECVTGADVLCAITSAKEPVIHGEWLKPGCHINAAGVNWANKRELDERAVRRSDLIVVDHREQSRIEAGDLIAVSDLDWSAVCELSDVVQGRRSRSQKNQITLFKSNGIAMEDIAAAYHVYSKMKTAS